MAEQVATVGAAALGLARSGHFEPLLHPFVSFLLRHGRNSLISKTAMQVDKPTPPHSPDIGGEGVYPIRHKIFQRLFSRAKNTAFKLSGKARQSYSGPLPLTAFFRLC